MAAASLFTRFIGFLYRLPLTDLIGDEGNAYYGAAYTIYLFALIVSAASLPAAISKMVSERLALHQYRNAHEVFRLSMLLALGLGAAGALFLALGADWLAEITRYPAASYAIMTLAPTIFIVSVMAVFRGYFQGMGNAAPTAASQTLEQIVNAAATLWLAYMFYDAAQIEFSAAGAAAGTGLGAAAVLLVVAGLYAATARTVKRRVAEDYFTSRYEFRSALVAEIIKTALPIVIGMAIFNIASIIDMTMVSGRLEAGGAFSPEEIRVLFGRLTGKYVVLTTLPVALSTALAVAAVPSIAGSFVLTDKRAVRSKIRTSLRLSMMVSIPAAVGMGVLSEPILTLLFPRHAEGADLLRYGAVSIVFLALTQIVTGILQGIGRVNVPLIGAFFGMLVKIPLNYFLIANPDINVVGAVISTCVCYFVAAAIDIRFLKKYVRIRLGVADALVKPLMASAVMGLFCYVAFHLCMYASQHNALSVTVSILFGIVVYIAYMALIKGFRRDEINSLPVGKRVKRLLLR